MNAINSNPTILIVDDEPANIILLDTILSPKYGILTARNGEEALELTTGPILPCMILLDVMMPGMDGYEVIRRLKDDPKTCNIPVVFVTAKNFAEDEERGLSLGAVDFITKPFRISTVIAKVAIHVELFQQRQFMESLAQKQFKQMANDTIRNQRTQSEQKQTIQDYLLDIQDNEERLRLALSASNTELWDWNLQNGRILRSNPIDDSDLPEHCEVGSTEPFREYIHPRDYPNFANMLKEHLLGNCDTYEVEFRIRTPSQTWEWRYATGKITNYDAQGNPMRLLGTLRNISRQKSTEEKLSIIAKSYESTSDGIWIANAQRKIIMINRAFTDITGFTHEKVNNTDFVFSNIELHQLQVAERANAALNYSRIWESDILNQRNNGEQYIQALRVSAVYNEFEELTHYIGVISDISLQKKAEEDLRKLANYDSLTGLPNRALFIERLEQEFKERKLKDYQFALLFLDLDNFKEINDSLGHDAGDQLLQTVARRLHSCCRPRDTAARLGGDEFTFIIQDISDVHIAAKTAQRILEEIELPQTILNKDIISTASIGIAIYPKDGENMGELMRHADTAMYSAKSKGKNSYQFFDQKMKDLAIARLTFEQDLRHAINNDEIVLHYQPKVDLLSGKPVGVEVLVRWFSENQGHILPEAFIPIAEETGLIFSLGEYILKTACYQYKRWLDKGIVNSRMSINVSDKQFSHPGFLQQVDEILSVTGLTGDHLEFEIKESMLVQDADKTILIMKALRNRNIALAIDDFGAGYSSLNYLKRFPVNTLKIDHNFIIDAMNSNKDKDIVKSMIQLGECLKLNVVVEGIETMEQAEEIREMSPIDIQGYLYSKPVPASEYEKLLTKNVNLYDTTCQIEPLRQNER